MWSELTQPELTNQFRHGFKITKSDVALTVTRFHSFFAVCYNTGCHSSSLTFFDVVLPNVSKLCRLCKLTDPSAQNFQRMQLPENAPKYTEPLPVLKEVD